MMPSMQMRIAVPFLALAVLSLIGGVSLSSHAPDADQGKATIGKQADGVYFVPTGQTIDAEGRNITFDGRPLDIALQPRGSILAVMLANEIRLLDSAHEQFLPTSFPGDYAFTGLAWSPDGRTLFAAARTSGAGSSPEKPEGAVNVVRFDSAGRVAAQKSILFPLHSRIEPNKKAEDSEPCGLAISPDGRTLYVALFNNGAVAAVDLSTYDPATGAAAFVEVPVGSSPERVLVSGDGGTIYVANRGGRAPQSGDTVDADDPVVIDPKTSRASTGTISVLSANRIAGAAEHAVRATIPVDLQPADLTLSPDGSRLFAANANSDTISVIDTATDRVVERIPTSPAPGRLGASSPNGLAISPRGDRLYVSLGGDNAVEVLYLDRAAGGLHAETRIAGLIPTAWFPVRVALSSDGTRLFTANSKGLGSIGRERKFPYSMQGTPQAGPGGAVIDPLLKGHTAFSVVGSVGVVPVPDAPELNGMTARAARNDHFARMEDALHGPLDPFWARFKHVFLIIKENRTYDQLFGDIPVPPGHVGGDPHLVMFGEKVTPNHHALAHEFGLFDNLYCSGEISADGHHWLNEAFADDYTERGVGAGIQTDYPRSYPCCGTDPLSFSGTPFVWQAALAAGRTFRNYGEMEPLPSMWRHSSRKFNGPFTPGPNRNRDVARVETILADMRDPAVGLPQLTYVWLSNDHTSGTRPGAYTPESCLADNDLALGMLVDGLSHSKRYWHDEPTALFIVEDDGQGGLDHVEGHRTVGLVVSPFNRRGQVDSTNYNHLSMIRTIELILGLKPLNQFDAAAMPMRTAFQTRADYRPYTALENRIALNLINPPLRRLSGDARRMAAVCARLDFSGPDRADPDLVTESLWRHTHAAESYPPADAAIW